MAPAPLPTLTNPNWLRFGDVYLANGFNATAAYRAAYPDASYESAQRAGWRLLRKVEIAAYVAARVEAVCKPLQMGGDEALAHIAIIARDGQERTHDRLKALRSILEVTGKVKGDTGVDELAAALRATLEQNTKAAP